MLKLYTSFSPMRRNITPEEVANTAMYLQRLARRRHRRDATRRRRLSHHGGSAGRQAPLLLVTGCADRERSKEASASVKIVGPPHPARCDRCGGTRGPLPRREAGPATSCPAGPSFRAGNACLMKTRPPVPSANVAKKPASETIVQRQLFVCRQRLSARHARSRPWLCRPSHAAPICGCRRTAMSGCPHRR